MFAIATLYVYYHLLIRFDYLRDADLAWAAPILASRDASKPMFIFQFALWTTTCSWEREGKLIGTHHPGGPYTYLVRVVDVDDNWKYE